MYVEGWSAPAGLDATIAARGETMPIEENGRTAADALLTITGKVETFSGESKLTRWAYELVIFAAVGKMNRHFWPRAGVALDDGDWNALPARGSNGHDRTS
jgi:hypothetical protein